MQAELQTFQHCKERNKWVFSFLFALAVDWALEKWGGMEERNCRNSRNES